MVAATVAARSANFASRGFALSRYGRRSTHFGSVGKRPASAGGSGMPSRGAKSLVELSHASSPSVTPIKSVSAHLHSSQKATSLFTHEEVAASGDASKIRKRD